jgi:hypothetical protein
MKQFQLDHGLAFIGLRDDESAAASLGVYRHMGALPLGSAYGYSSVQPRFRFFYGGNLAIVLVQFHPCILLTNVIGSPTTLRAKPFLSRGIPSDDKVFHLGPTDPVRVSRYFC